MLFVADAAEYCPIRDEAGGTGRRRSNDILGAPTPFHGVSISEHPENPTRHSPLPQQPYYAAPTVLGFCRITLIILV